MIRILRSTHPLANACVTEYVCACAFAPYFVHAINMNLSEVESYFTFGFSVVPRTRKRGGEIDTFLFL